MNEPTCDQYVMAALLQEENLPSDLPDWDVAAHVAACEVCRAELAGQFAIERQLAQAERTAFESPSTWTAIEPRLAPHWPYRGLLIGLLAGKLVEWLTGQDQGYWFDVLLAAGGLGLLVYLRDSLFRIVETAPEGDEA